MSMSRVSRWKKEKEQRKKNRPIPLNPASKSHSSAPTHHAPVPSLPFFGLFEQKASPRDTTLPQRAGGFLFPTNCLHHVRDFPSLRRVLDHALDLQPPTRFFECPGLDRSIRLISVRYPGNHQTPEKPPVHDPLPPFLLRRLPGRSVQEPSGRRVVVALVSASAGATATAKGGGEATSSDRSRRRGAEEEWHILFFLPYVCIYISFCDSLSVDGMGARERRSIGFQEKYTGDW